MWVVPAGMIGARLYHVLTDWKPISEWHKIWEGGLGVPGAILAGAIAGIFFVRRRGLPMGLVADAVAPTLPLAQAIGRWGNWWNQELYGKPTDLPWALEIDQEIGHVPAEYAGVSTFHPTVLYESLWNFALTAFLIWLGRTGRLKVGYLIWVYAGGYALGRLWIEALRIDPATEILGLRINHWTMGILLATSILLLWNKFGPPGSASPQHGDLDDLSDDEDDAEVQRVDEEE